MRLAAIPFLIAAVAYLAWDVIFTFANGVHIGTWLMAAFSWALAVIGWGLYRRRASYRWVGLVASLFVAATCIVILGALALPYAPHFAVPSLLWPMLSILSVVALAFVASAVLLARGRRHAP
jgi:hypothetical protein